MTLAHRFNNSVVCLHGSDFVPRCAVTDAWQLVKNWSEIAAEVQITGPEGHVCICRLGGYFHERGTSKKRKSSSSA
eukprot:4519557-Amphidinium_carterae.2